ncbi:hypothetical protein GGR56DRAFT_373305 [Xylariaceae sp. FL0804]|nr:hypothetical protein GGR56DRAFT_373305 [Xylariaceae sp. FL0804]
MSTSALLPLARLAILFAALIPASRAVSVGDVFIVKMGTTNGGCDNQNIDGWFADSQTLANSAATGAAATDSDSRKYLQTFFSIKPGDDATQAGNPIGQVQAVLQGTSTPPGGKPWLFCSSDWLQEQQWTDVAFDETTGQPRTDGMTVQQVFGVQTIPAGKSPFWSDDLRAYIEADSGDFCADPDNVGATQDQTAPSTLTLCINNFKTDQGDTLADIPTVSQAKVSISTLQVHSLTFFHEMFHLALGTTATPEPAGSYNLNSIVRFGTPRAISNPESYTFYALAYFLGQNTQFTFANSKSAAKPAINPKRSWFVSQRDALAPFQLDRRDLAKNAWVA